MDDQIEVLARFTAELLAAIEQRTRRPEMSFPQWLADMHGIDPSPAVGEPKRKRETAGAVA